MAAKRAYLAQARNECGLARPVLQEGARPLTTNRYNSHLTTIIIKLNLLPGQQEILY